MNIVVLAGGLSPERDVSLSSGCMIANALLENGHNVILADLYIGFESVDNFADAHRKYKKDKYKFAVPEREPDLEAVRQARKSGGVSLIGEGILPICADADITFNALHGSIGENGRLQAVFDVFGVKYTGTGYEGSFMAMDKPLAKEIMRINGIETPPGYVFDAHDICGAEVMKRIEPPWAVKPCGCGSSVGVSLIDGIEEFDAAVKYARAYEDKILVEKKIVGREFSVGILGGEALPPIEIIPNAGFYDYRNKYQPGASKEICPPEGLPPEVDAALRETTLKVHRALRLGDYSRLDAIVGEDGKIYVLEINTLPGMTPTSLIPQEAAAVGISYGQLCERIVNLALNKK